MSNKLHFRRNQDEARSFEIDALEVLWSHPDVGGYYPPQAKDKYRLQAMILQDDGRPVTEDTVSVMFLLSDGNNTFVEIALQDTPGNFKYAGYIAVPTKDGDVIKALDGKVEDVAFNGHFVISTARESGRVLFGYEPLAGKYRELVAVAFTSQNRAVAA